MELGKNIARYRKLKKIRAVDLAKLAGVGQPYISEIETGKKLPSLDVLRKIAKVLGTTTSELLEEVHPKLDDNMVRLVDAAQSLNTTQVDAFIEVINSFTYDASDNNTGNCRVAEES